MAKRSRARRFLRRGELIPLRPSRPEEHQPPSSAAPDPEITETEIWLRRLPPAYNGLRVVHLTDIHHSLFTPLETVNRAVHLANQLHPDVVALTGDYVTLSPSYIWPVARALGKLRSRLGTYAVLGNHDFQVDAEEMTRALRAQRIRVLRNSHYALRSRGSTLWLAGVDDLWWNADDFPAALGDQDAMASVARKPAEGPQHPRARRVETRVGVEMKFAVSAMMAPRSRSRAVLTRSRAVGDADFDRFIGSGRMP